MSLIHAVAQFDPPEALRQYDAWRVENAAARSEVPFDAIQIDTGRTERGDFVRVWVTDDHAARFR